MPRGQLMVGFSESPEFVTATGTTAPQSINEGLVARAYVAFLNRTPEETEAEYWVGQLDNGMTAETFARSLATSDEFGNLWGELDDWDFLDISIQRLLGGYDDSIYERYWEAASNGTLDRARLLLDLMDLPEVVMTTGTTPVSGLVVE